MAEKKTDGTPGGVFVSGSTMGHVIRMTGTGSIGMLAIFAVDFIDMFFLSLLGEAELAAAIGFAGSILFFTMSVSIGLAIGVSVMVSRMLGAGDSAKAGQYTVSGLVLGVLLLVLLAIVTWLLVPVLLEMLGASGRTADYARRYLNILIPSMPLMVAAMMGGALLRSSGLPKFAMYSTLLGALANAVLDPLLIFTAGLGIEGAALASAIARFVMFAVAIVAVWRATDLMRAWNPAGFFGDMRDIARIAGPAVLTNVATPIGNIYVMAAAADFGDSAVAGMSIVGRIIPFAFAATFALSGSIGPIVGQNIGAERIDRVRSTLKDSLIFIAGYVAVVWLILALLADLAVTFFSATGVSADVVRLFCLGIAGSFFFNGAQFVANAAFNNLGRPMLSTLFNFAKATIGTIPFVYAGGLIWGPQGILVGQALGGSLVAMVAIFMMFGVVRRLEREGIGALKPAKRVWRIPFWPQSSPRV
ncbi:MATE family efflux transporter [Aestuariispira insulae]|uniref:Multidrug-efflux transporter n=1 Tax=Aestuariispira insulae TaxID=1461337 RepID=A0A3D9HXW2_9PROT|nr:MATE family efflux transporter [Aestuariispira insulae]RED54342.1 putative MATE family efflux protein [Aestuariispira insulae]